MSENNFTFTPAPPIAPTAIAEAMQRKTQIETQMQQQQDERSGRLLQAVIQGQQIAGSMMDMAQKRQIMHMEASREQGLQNAQAILNSPMPAAPAPTASSTAIGPSGPTTAASSALPDEGNFPVKTSGGMDFPVQPSQEQTDQYQQQIKDRTGRLSAALMQADPKGVTDLMAKSLFTGPKQTNLSLETKPVLYNGQPTEALFDKGTGNWYDPSTKQQLTGKIEPYSPLNQTDLTDADRKRLTPLAQAVIDGRAQPSQLANMRGNEREKLALVSAELDPKFDLTQMGQRAATRRDFSSAGKSGQALTSLNTVIGHLDTLSSKIDKLDGTEIPKYNSLRNFVNKNSGKPEVQEFTAAKTFVDNELGKIAQGSGVVTDAERKQISDSLNASSSPTQAKAVIDTYMDLMKSRVDALQSNWDSSMPGVKPPVPFINDRSKAKLVKHGYDPITMEKAQASNSSDRPALNSFYK